MRTSLLMSAVTQQPLRLHAVRGATRRTGLTPEDLTFLQMVEQSTGAEVRGDTLHSQELFFAPRHAPRALKGKFDVGSQMEGRVPGGALILASAIVPLVARAGAYSTFTIHGETHTNNVLSFDSFERSTVAVWRRQGLFAFPSLVASGFGFGARGEVALDVEPSALEPVDWIVRGELLSIGAVVTTSDMAPQAGERVLAMLAHRLEGRGVEPETSVNPVHGVESGLSVTVFAEFERGCGSGSCVLERGQNLSAAAEGAWGAFAEWFDTKAAVDPYLADQMLLPAILTPGLSRFTTPCLTRRLLTMVWVVKQFLPIKITVRGREGEPGTVEVERG